MSFLSYLFPQTILITSSKYNKLIRINEENGKLKLLVNGSRQSGTYIEKLWREAFKKFNIKTADRILVLGVGGGTVIQLLRTYNPKAKIKAIDIDRKIIAIAKKYFGIGETLIQSDAKEFVQRKGNYDLIIVDLFFGNQIPDFVASKEFLHNVKKLGGIVVINYLREAEYLQRSDNLKQLLTTIFKRVTDFTIESNRFFLAH